MAILKLVQLVGSLMIFGLLVATIGVLRGDGLMAIAGLSAFCVGMPLAYGSKVIRWLLSN